MSVKDGGPAFPLAVSEGQFSRDGMSLRDYFAGRALHLLAGRAWDHVGDDLAIVRTWARTAYIVADAMLAERSK